MMTDVLPQTMTAIEIRTPGAPDVLTPVSRPMPALGDDDVLVRVRAAGVNRPDLMQRQGKYPPPPGASDIPGLEVAGTVEQLGSGVSGWRVGDPVCALVAGGGYAEYCTAPAPQCLPPPRGLDLVAAAAVGARGEQCAALRSPRRVRLKCSKSSSGRIRFPAPARS